MVKRLSGYIGYIRTGSKRNGITPWAFLRRAPVFAFAGIILFGFVESAQPYTQAQKAAFQRTIVDRQHQLNRKYRKNIRNTTKYIIVHTSEGGLASTLRAVSEGKRVKGRIRTRGGHAHYVIARDGRTYRIMDHRYVADHAGLSMWNGQTDISKVSVGIELVGYHYTPITEQQYRSVGQLILILQDFYHLDDKSVLTHSQVAYGRANHWFKREHRGRKRCAKNFYRVKAGLAPTWPMDPDVKAGRLQADPELASIFYAKRPAAPEHVNTNLISRTNTAWNIAGDEYNDSTTVYQLPNGRRIPGDEIERTVGWSHMPENTMVFLNQQSDDAAAMDQGPVKSLADGNTAWDYAGAHYNKSSTFYFFPGGRHKNGKEISDWDGMPSQTKMIIGYRGPYEVTTQRTPVKIAGKRFDKKETLYYFPNKEIVCGDAVKDFSRLPKGVLVFIPERG